jgi:hypothetical protein
MGENCGKLFFMSTLGEELSTKWKSGTTGWSQFIEDHDIHQGFFMTFDFHIGTSKFNVKVYDCTQCQKEYEVKVHFH